ncbi:hypothetical protein C8R47DRAFT_1282470 [Mycena vitilis]|nr:hypothetical protein C8R47DRAFT_1282470 [Mycena vitilis]
MPQFPRLLAISFRRLGSAGSFPLSSSGALGNVWRRPMSGVVHPESSQPTTPAARPASPIDSSGIKPKKQRKPPRSDAQIAEDEAAAAALVEKMTSKETLERALDALTPRVSEAFKLAAFTELTFVFLISARHRVMHCALWNRKAGARSQLVLVYADILPLACALRRWAPRATRVFQLPILKPAMPTRARSAGLSNSYCALLLIPMSSL